MSDPAYLTAKRTVDDRALDQSVLGAFADALADSEAPHLLEVGAGTGTMVARLAGRGLLPGGTTYLAVDRDRAHVEAARERVPDWLARSGYTVEESEDGLVASRDGRTLRVEFAVADAFDVDVRTDAIVAGAFLDLVALPDGIEQLTALFDDGGLLYAPITFDGLTGFVPGHPADEAVVRAYHRHMEWRDQPGAPDAGRRVLEAVPELGGAVVAVGGSDWIIRPRDGSYPAGERAVLEHLLSTVLGAVRELDDPAPSPESLAEWERRRRAQLDRAELTFLAHNLDVLARF